MYCVIVICNLDPGIETTACACEILYVYIYFGLQQLSDDSFGITLQQYVVKGHAKYIRHAGEIAWRIRWQF